METVNNKLKHAVELGIRRIEELMDIDSGWCEYDTKLSEELILIMKESLEKAGYEQNGK